MSLLTFKNEIQELNEKIIDMSHEVPFIDGAFNEDEYYYSNPYRIMWLMKEAYGDPFSYPDFYKNDYDKFCKDLLFGLPRATWGPVVYVSYSILNNFKPFAQIERIKNNPEIIKILSKVAWVNINKKKSDTGSFSTDANIQKASDKYSEILDQQIALLKPNIVICGNTFKFIEKRLGFPQKHTYDSEESFVPHYIVNNTLYIDPFHPAYPGSNKIDLGLYVKDIDRTIKKYFESISFVYKGM